MVSIFSTPQEISADTNHQVFNLRIPLSVLVPTTNTEYLYLNILASLALAVFSPVEKREMFQLRTRLVSPLRGWLHPIATGPFPTR